MDLTHLRRTERFKQDYKRAPPEVKTAAEKILRDMLGGPVGRMRMHSLNAYYPTIHKVDVFSNKSWQISFVVENSVELNDEGIEEKRVTAALRRLATHKDMDRNP